MYPLFGIRNVFNRQSSTVAGDAWTKFSASGSSRAGVEIRNADPTLKLWVRRVERGTSAPSAPAGPQDADFAIDPDTTLALGYADSVDIYLANSSGSGTTSKFVVSEVAF